VSRRICIIGYGAISRALVQLLAEEPPSGFTLAIGLRPGSAHWDDVAARFPIISDEAGMRAFAPDLVVEAAGHGVVRELVPSLLRAGCPVLISSVGALHDDAVLQDIIAAAQAGGTRLILPSGALAALDYVRAVRGTPGLSIRYESRKSAQAWRGELATLGRDADTLVNPVTLMEGTARAAAARFPANLNVAATLAIAAGGFEAVKVAVVADPALSGNRHSVIVESAAGTMRVEVENRPSAENPKTSAIVAPAIVAAIRQMFSPIQIL
jgi:aspartate dehydrogenase